MPTVWGALLAWSLGQTAPVSAFPVEALLQRTEATLKPPTPAELFQLAGGLVALGEPDAARRLLRATAPIDHAGREQFVQRLLSLGHHEVAAPILERWRREQPDAVQPMLLVAALYHTSNQPELERRALIEIRALANKLTPAQRDLVDLQLRSVGRPLGVDGNPWNVRFVDASGKIPIGTLDAGELTKLPANAETTLAAWLELSPRLGNLWALLGLTRNARGDTAGALACFQRAKMLTYTPPLARDALFALERIEQQRKVADLAKLAGSQRSAKIVDAAPTGGNVVALEPSATIMVTIAVGSLVIGLLLGMQVRNWMSKGSAH